MNKLSNINLDITNFGPINNANLELKKLNVIAGVNGSGKSTSSKLLYCFLTSISDEKDYLANWSINERFIPILRSLNFDVELDEDTLNRLSKISDKVPLVNDDSYNIRLKEFITPLKKIISESQIYNKEDYIKKLDALESVLEKINIGHRKFFDVSNMLLRSEFKLKDLKLDNTNVHMYGEYNGQEFSYELDSNESGLGFMITDGTSDCFNIGNVIYVDSPSIFDANLIGSMIILENQHYHLRSLSQALNSLKNNDDVYDSLFNQKLDEFKDEITALIGGYIYFDDEDEEFKFKKGDEVYSMKNTASGVKQLGIVQMLLSNRKLNENSFVIMDEPEVSLHPEWQVKFAEIIVFMIKELNISVFINSHSPQFIEALEVYSGKYGLVDESRFYLSCEKEKDEFDFEEIHRDDLVILYNNLGDPYDVINNVRAQNMKKGIF